MPVCPRCRSELDSADPAGLCPKCLILGAFDSSAGVEESATRTIDASSAAAADDEFGRYRILRPLGEGGMGTVYLAEQQEPIRRRVALKVVKLGMDSAQVLVRFHNERQALAMMEHPNIAQIFDAGVTGAGRPYFVMEYIDGASITHYCDSRRLTTRERLGVFLAVCRAVRHAHEKRVIHRDLKPSNILVAEPDGTPVPKVIDFGIAKATDKWAVESTLLTEFGQIVGTLEYASPEQADTMTGALDELSDVYSLGVILYELMIGAVPFDSTTLRAAGLAEMLRIIREEEAPSLPRRLTSLGEGATDIAARRQTDPASLRRLVDGDLNAIAMKALEKVREHRYASVSDLAADVQRLLEDRPVLASPPGRIYRTRRFLRRNRMAVLGTAAGTAFLVMSGVALWSVARGSATPRLTDRDTIVLADFDNKTGDPVFDDTLRQGLSVELQQSPYLALISDAKVQQTLALLGKPKDARLTPEIAQQVCSRTGSAAVLDGSIARVGSQYVLGLRAKDCGTGNVLDRQQAVAPRKEDVMNALSEISRKFRQRAGESLATVERHSMPLAEATTPSLEALKAYSTATKLALASANSEQSAIPLLRRAVEIDPDFAMAYAYLGFRYGRSDSARSAEYAAKAWQLRNRVSDRERFYIDFTYHRQVTGDLEKAYRTLELWRQVYPRRGALFSNAQDLLTGIATQGTGRFERTIEAALDGIATDPDLPFPYMNLAHAQFHTDHFPAAENTIQRASARKIQAVQTLMLQYNLAALGGDRRRMDEIAASARGKRASGHRIAHAESLALARSGRLRAARASSKRAVELALQEAEREVAATYTAARAVWEALCGNSAEARTAAAAALELSTGRDVEYAASLALALAGSSARAEALAAGLVKRFPEDTFVTFTYAPVLQALAAQGAGKFTESVERLQTTLSYELAVNGLNFPYLMLGGLHSSYLRGQAYLALRKHAEAAAEFQKILDHRGPVGLDPIGTLAHWQLGRVFASSGNRIKAKAAGEAFFTLWKDADPDVPILKIAKAEYAKL